MWLLSFPTSYLADWTLRRGLVSTGTSRKICNSIGNIVPAIALIALGYIDSSHTVLAVSILVIAVGFNVPTLCGYQVNHMDLSPNFAGTLMGMTNGTANIFAILAPLITGFIVRDTVSIAKLRFAVTSGALDGDSRFFFSIFIVQFQRYSIKCLNGERCSSSHPVYTSLVTCVSCYSDRVKYSGGTSPRTVQLPAR